MEIKGWVAAHIKRVTSFYRLNFSRGGRNFATWLFARELLVDVLPQLIFGIDSVSRTLDRNWLVMLVVLLAIEPCVGWTLISLRQYDSAVVVDVGFDVAFCWINLQAVVSNATRAQHISDQLGFFVPLCSITSVPRETQHATAVLTAQSHMLTTRPRACCAGASFTSTTASTSPKISGISR